MMTKQEHIDHWVSTAAEDWITVEVLFTTERYMHCLFWSHLTLEKLAKAHWIKNHNDNIPPKVHNIVWLLDESGVDLGNETMGFLENFNDFQLSSRYPDYLNKMYKICTKDFATAAMEKVKEVRTCLLKMLQ
ncbi:MAG: HEPN domain-containing protein [Tannerella sp.]|nr:HEPN domain-containing protein [Tannerella sp.]